MAGHVVRARPVWLAPYHRCLVELEEQLFGVGAVWILI